MSNSKRKNIPAFTAIASIILTLCLISLFINSEESNANAAMRYIRDGKEYGLVTGSFRHRWWNYYERSLSFADGEFFAEAVNDLNEAIKQRGEDQRMARTYGMHFIDYFPNRELGIICFQMGNLDEAKKLLELSLSQYPSAKARFYLDQVRKEIIKITEKDVVPPVLALDLQQDEIRTNADPVVISGTAGDSNFVSAISVGDDFVFMDGAQRNVKFEKKLILGQGRHDINITAKNLLEKKADKKIIIHVDRHGPFISIDELTPDSGGDAKTVRISGSAIDESGIAVLRICGSEISTHGETEIEFNRSIHPEDNTLEVTAEDKLGNITTAKIDLPEKHSNLLASLDSDATKFLTASILGNKDKKAPVINLKGWTDAQTVFMEKIYLEGEIIDENKVVSVSVNQVPVLRREGQIIFFNRLIDLNEGDNVILIKATDENGNTSTKKTSVTRKTPKALSLSERLGVAVLPFEASGEVSQAFISFEDNLINALTERDRFNMVEREKLDIVLQEQQLSKTKLIDNKTAVKVGKLLAAQSIITGSVVETRKGVEIVARMIDAETSEILAASDVYDEGKDLKTMSSLATGLAIKFHRQFPMAFGLVVQQKGSDIFTDLGQGMVKVTRRLIVYKEEPIRHPITGKMLGSDNIILGRLRVTQVMQDMSKTKISQGDTSKIKLMDKVVTE